MARTQVCSLVGNSTENFDIPGIESSNFRTPYLSIVFNPPSPGIPVFLVQLQY